MTQMDIKLCGTFILAVQCREGLLVCVEKGGVLAYPNGSEVIVRDQTKLFVLAPNIILTAYGSPILVEEKNPNIQSFNIINPVQAYFASHQFDNSDYFWNKLKEVINAVFKHYIDNGGDNNWSDEELRQDPRAFGFVFFYPDESGMIRLTQIEMIYDRPNSPHAEIESDHWFEGLFTAFGNYEVLDILYTNDPSIEHVKQKKVVRILLSDARPEQISAEQARAFIDILIAEANRRNSELSAEKDCYLVKGKTEFRPVQRILD